MKTDRIIEIVLEIFGWLQITAGCFMMIALLGAAFCPALPAHERMNAFLIICVAGLLLGIFCASFVWKKYGTIAWLSRIRRIS